MSAFLLLTSVTAFGAELGVNVNQVEDVGESNATEPPATQKPTIVELMESERQMLTDMERISQEKEEQRLEALEAERLAKEKAEKELRDKAEAERKAREHKQKEKERQAKESEQKTKTQSNDSNKGRLLGTFEATAYTDNEQSQGKWVGQTATGRKPQVGVIAVDPNVIPLNTKLYVEGYGNCVAGDTGGAIKGKRLDLFHNTQGECTSFGRRSVQVWIVD